MQDKLHQAFFFLRHYFTASRKGHGVHSPFAYQLCEEVFYNSCSFYRFMELEQIRKKLLMNTTELQVKDLGAGSKTFSSSQRRVCDIARKGISGAAQSQLFFKLIHLMGIRNVVELGTSLGLNALYLAAAGSKKVISIEGSESLADFARTLAAKNGSHNVTVVTGHFDEVLPEVLAKQENADLVYIDGNHTCEATLRYFNMIKPFLNNNSVVILDDIYWSRGMTQAWNLLKNDADVRLSIDTFKNGFLFFRKEIRQKTHLRFLL